MKDSQQKCLHWILFIYVCSANTLEISLLFINLSDNTCSTTLSSVSFSMFYYFIGFFGPAAACFLFLLTNWWIDCCIGVPSSFDPSKMIKINMLWRFIWVAVGIVILFKDLVPNNQCSNAILIMEIDFYLFYGVLSLLLLVLIIDKIGDKIDEINQYRS
jgi:hypothetical protein